MKIEEEEKKRKARKIKNEIVFHTFKAEGKIN